MSSSISATLSATASASASAVADPNASPASYKVIGVLLAVGSGIFIGGSFVLKKKVSRLVPYSKLREEKRREEKRGGTAKSRIWRDDRITDEISTML